MDAALQAMGTCLDVTSQGNKAQCASQLYTRVNSGLSDSDPDKAPSLKLITRMYSLLTRFDRNEISWSEVQNGARQFANELKIDLQRARYYSAVQNEMESRRIRQLFQEAERLASPTNSNLRTCRPAPGYGPGAAFCK
jgi:hypothetical protein